MSWGFDFMVNIHRSKFWLYTCRVNNSIVYEEGLDSQEMREKMEEAKSKLMGFFDYYATHLDEEKHLYVDFPSYSFGVTRIVVGVTGKKTLAESVVFMPAALYRANVFISVFC